jgi:hypothetical protein
VSDDTQPKFPEIDIEATGQSSIGMAFCGGLQDTESGFLLPSLMVNVGLEGHKHVAKHLTVIL